MTPTAAVIVEGEQQFRGTSFLIAVDTALTAFHCVGDRQTGELLHRNLNLAFDDANVRNAHVVDFDSELDVALLLFDGGLPEGADVVPIANTPYLSEHFRCPGYPGAVSQVDRVSLTGQVADPDVVLFERVRAIQLFGNEAAARLPLRGMSGAPVLVDNPEVAVGLVRWNPTRPGAYDEALGGVVYATRMSEIVARWPQLAVHRRDRGPTIHSFEDTSLISSNKGSIGGVLGTERRNQLLESQFTQYASEWVPLPAFYIVMPLDKDPNGQDAKRTLKLMLRGIATGISRFLPEEVAEFQCVALIKWWIAEDEFHFRLWIPFPPIVGYMHRLARNAEKALAEVQEHPDIHYELASPAEVLTPVVIVHSPQAAMTRLLNKNQFADPLQFFDPSKSLTTSGLLNAIGSLAILEQSGEGKAFAFDNVDALGSDFDEWIKWLVHVSETGAYFEPGRIYVNTQEPESYRYDYISGASVS